MPITISYGPKPRIWIVCFVQNRTKTQNPKPKKKVQNPKIIHLPSNMTDKSNKSSHLKDRMFGIFAWKMNKHISVAQNLIFWDKTSNFKTSSWALEICDRHIFLISLCSQPCLFVCWISVRFLNFSENQADILASFHILSKRLTN